MLMVNWLDWQTWLADWGIVHPHHLLRPIPVHPYLGTDSNNNTSNNNHHHYGHYVAGESSKSFSVKHRIQWYRQEAHVAQRSIKLGELFR